MTFSKTILGAALAATLAMGGAGCKTVYEPVVVRESVSATRLDPLAMQLPEAGAPGTPLQHNVVLLRARTVVDWPRIGRVSGDVLEGIGVGLWYATLISLRVLAECGACLCR